MFEFKRFTVGALIHGWVEFMGADGNAVERAVVLILAMVSTLLNRTFNALVCVTLFH